MTQAELEQFFQGLVRILWAGGVTCAITSGMACVNYGVAEATKDCDLLCAPDGADRFLAVISEARWGGVFPSYRGNISPPLDVRWLRGGWTSHFVWKAPPQEAYLDVFGIAPRGSSRWEQELHGFYASPHTVGEMKRTNREKDWPFATALGVILLEAGDARGWLHLFHESVLLELIEHVPCPPAIVAKRPVLRLALEKSPKLKVALKAEIEFWVELDLARLRIYERAVRPYVAAVRRSRIPKDAGLITQHRIRLECAGSNLAENPLRTHGLEAMSSEARAEVSAMFGADSAAWLPDVRENFIFLTS